jgi:hypothetical protein
MKNNYENIKFLLDFSNEGDFYFVQIIKRRKDVGNEDMSRGERIVDNFYIHSMEEYDKYKERILESVKINNARAYIHVNKRNTKRIALEVNKLIGEYLLSEQYKAVKSVYTTACGRFSSASKGERKWIVDADSDKEIAYMRQFLNDNAEILAELPTKNGLHFITKPFNLMLYKNEIGFKVFPSQDIKKNSPTLLAWN